MAIFSPIAKFLRRGIQVINPRNSQDGLEGAIIRGKWGGYDDLYDENALVVDPKLAMSLSAVWAAIRLLSSSVAMLPVRVYQNKEEQQDEELPKHPVARLLRRPNQYMTRYLFLKLVMTHLLLRGNFYAFKFKDKRGQVIELIPFDPNRMEVIVDSGMKFYRYTITEQKGIAGGRTEYIHQKKIYMADEVLHVMGETYDGVIGLSPIEIQRRSIEGGLRQQEHMVNFYRRGASPSGVLQHEKRLSDEARQRLRDRFEEAAVGTKNAHKTLVLEEGLQYQPISVSMRDAEFIQQQELTIRDIARIFGVQPHLLADLSQATFSNIEHQSREYFTYSIQPHLYNLEHEFNKSLIRTPEVFVKFDDRSAQKPDIKSHYEALSAGVQAGINTINEVRAILNLPPIEGGDIAIAPLNLRALDKLVEADVPTRSKPE